MRLHLHIWKKLVRFARVCRVCGEVQGQELVSKWHFWETKIFVDKEDFAYWLKHQKELEKYWNQYDVEKKQENQKRQKQLQISNKIVKDSLR